MLDELTRLSHTTVSAAGTTERGIDQVLSQLGLERRVVARVQRFSGLPAALSSMPPW